MKVIIGHINTDFDAFSSMYAAKLLYPDACMVLHEQVEKDLKRFLNLYKEELPIIDFKDLNLDDVNELIIVDTNSISRIGKFGSLLNQNIKYTVFDHHPLPEDSIQKDGASIADIGANTTYLVELIIQNNIFISSFDATIIALGIYADTGNFSYASTTARDAKALSYLLEQGANIQEINRWIQRGLEEEQQQLFTSLLEKLEISEVNGVKIATVAHLIDHYIGGLNKITEEMLDVCRSHVIFCAVTMKKHTHICARSNVEELDMGLILEEFNGGGHRRAASGVLKNQQVSYKTIQKLKNSIEKQLIYCLKAKDIMSSPVKTLPIDFTIQDAYRIMLLYGHNGMPILDQNELAGMLTKKEVEKAIFHQLGHAPVESFMTKEIISVDIDTSIYEIEKKIIDNNIGRLPVVSDGKLMGIITRSDFLYHIYQYKKNGTNLHKDSSYVLGQLKSFTREVQELFQNMGNIADVLGYKVYVVGGFVRDLLLEKENSDIDFIVEGSGIALAEAYRNQYGGSLTIHPAFGTATLVLKDGYTIDIVTARREYYASAGALPTVEEGSIYVDLFRRDFTINSIAILLNVKEYGKIIDYFGGMKDLKNGTIRVLHKLSFIEDPTRIFRAIRFEGRFDFSMDGQTESLALYAINNDFLSKVSKERIQREIQGIFLEKKSAKILERMKRLGLMQAIYSEIRITQKILDALNKIETTKETIKILCKQNEILDLYKIGLYVLFIGQETEIAQKYLQEMHLTKTMRKEIHQLIEFQTKLLLDFTKTIDPWASYKGLLHFSIEQLIALMCFYPDQKLESNVKNFLKYYRDVKLEITGKDLIVLGVAPNIKMKELLDKALRFKIDNLSATKEEILSFIKTELQELGDLY